VCAILGEGADVSGIDAACCARAQWDFIKAFRVDWREAWLICEVRCGGRAVPRNMRCRRVSAGDDDAWKVRRQLDGRCQLQPCIGAWSAIFAGGHRYMLN
jgi:hypothetical protein